jgi:nicotinate phosphoribosyltransferase
MIQSILDNDLYKFTMQQAVHKLYPRAHAEYVFINRAKTRFPEGFAQKLRAGVKGLAGLKLSSREKTFLKDTCYFLTPVYLDFLEHYTFDPGEVDIREADGRLTVTIAGPWYRTILWEVPLMAMISELYFVMTGAQPIPDSQRASLNIRKARVLGENNIRFADFGTRRRFSYKAHKALIRDLLKTENSTLIGTSNVHLARLFSIKPIGTLAHEWFMFHAVLNGYRMANITAVDAWVKVFHGDLGITLTDTFTTPVFLETFDTLHAKLFDGVRHDSGDPFEFVDTITAHYRKLRIDPLTKTIVFSDSLDMDKAVAIHDYCRGKIKSSYGIGTNLTNDVGVIPLNMVIKMSRCQTGPDRSWHEVVKLSDDPGKNTGDMIELNHCRAVLERSF